MKMNQLLPPKPSAQPGQMDLSPFHEVFGEETPDIQPSPLGRYRLVQALRNKFGDNYRASPTSLKLLNHFDSQYESLRPKKNMGGLK